MSNFYNDLDIDGVLSCPICYEVPPKEIYLCKIGHHICCKCRRKLSTCPTCQSALTSSRNFLAEELITKFSIFKEYEESPSSQDNNNQSTTETSPTQPKLEDNRSSLRSLSLPPGVYKCLLEFCCNRKPMGAGNLFRHVDKAHTHLFDKFQNSTATFKHDFQNFCLMKGKRKFHRAFHVTNMGLFYLNLAVTEDKYINCWLSLPAPVRVTNRFDYQLEFVKEEGEKKFVFVNKVASNLQSAQWLLERGRAFVIPPTQHSLTENQFFSLLVKIVYKASAVTDT